MDVVVLHTIHANVATAARATSLTVERTPLFWESFAILSGYDAPCSDLYADERTRPKTIELKVGNRHAHQSRTISLIRRTNSLPLLLSVFSA